MTKKENYILANEVLQKSQSETKALGYSFTYDIITKCQDYGLNKGQTDITPAYFDKICSNKGKIFIDINFIYDFIRQNPDNGILSLASDFDLKSFMVLYHELTHVYQQALNSQYSYSKNKSQFSSYYRANYIFQKMFYEKLGYYEKIYRDYHHYYPNEHEANVHGIKNSIELLNIDELDSFKKILLLGYEKTGTRIYSPFDILKAQLNIKDKKLMHQFKEVEELIPKLSLYDRLSLGLKVDDNEFSEIKRHKESSQELIMKLNK